jgi:CRP-like cAMP-binding protein
METLERLIGEHAFFAGLDARYLSLLVSCAANVRFQAGQMLFSHGEEANHFYLIRDGKVAVEIHSPTRGSLMVQTLLPGEVLGWSWLIPPYRWRFDARALEPIRVLALDGKCLRAKCEQDHDLGYELFKRLSQIMTQRLEAALLQLLDVYAVHA